VFSKSAIEAYLEKTEPISIFKTVIYRKYSLQKIIQFSLGNNVLDVTASTGDGCLWRDTCVSSNQLNMPIWNQMSLSPT
jgi:hypothetical protein